MNQETKNEFVRELRATLTVNTGEYSTEEVFDRVQCEDVVDLIVEIVDKVLASRGFVYSKSGE